MEIYLIRHGQADNNMPGWQRTPEYMDANLTQLGKVQAIITGRYLAGQDIKALYCSPLVRCLQTATYIGEATGLQPHVWAHTYEVARDEFYGSPMEHIAENYPHIRVPLSPDDTGWWECCVDESEEILSERAQHTFRELVRLHGDSDDRIAVVAHGGFNSRLLSEILELPPSGYQRFRQNNTCINRFLVTEGRIQIIATNDQAHLPDYVRS